MVHEPHGTNFESVATLMTGITLARFGKEDHSRLECILVVMKFNGNLSAIIDFHQEP